MKKNSRGRWRALPLFLPVLFVVGCAKNYVTHEHNVKLISEATEFEIGKKGKEDIIKQYGTYSDLPWHVYLDRVGQRVAKASERPQMAYDFTLLDTDSLNAFALPGGFVFVTRGLLEQAADEAELAIVLGHEITHTAASHGVAILQKAGALKALTVAGAIGGAVAGAPGESLAIAQAAGVYENLYLLGYGRDKEIEADRYGIYFAAKAGYDPEAALTFFERLKQTEQDEGLEHQISPYWRSHPSTTERLGHAKEWIATVEKDYPSRDYNRDAYQAMVARFGPTDSPERGTVAGNVYTNSIYKIRLEAPPGWILDNGPRSALVVFNKPSAGIYGVLQRVPISPSMGVLDLANKIIKEWQLPQVRQREVDYPAGRGLLLRYGNRQFSVATLVLVQGTSGFLMSCRMPRHNAAPYALEWETLLRSLRLEAN